MIMRKYIGSQMHVKVGQNRKSVDLFLEEDQAKSLGASMILLNSLFEPHEFKACITYDYVESDQEL